MNRRISIPVITSRRSSLLDQELNAAGSIRNRGEEKRDRALRPEAFWAVTSAPWSSRAQTTPSWPPEEAQCKGVWLAMYLPSSSVPAMLGLDLALGSALFERRVRATSSWPCSAAR